MNNDKDWTRDFDIDNDKSQWEIDRITEAACLAFRSIMYDIKNNGYSDFINKVDL